MNIGIDATGMGWQKGGAAFYVINIIKGLAAVDKNNRYFVFCSDKSFSSLQGLPANTRVLKSAPNNVALRLLWEQTVLPFYLCRKYNIDVLFGPNYIIPLLQPGFRTVVTIHDLSFYPLADLYPASRKVFKWIIRWSIKCANSVIVISECTKRDIQSYIGDYANKVTVIYLAAEERFNRNIGRDRVSAIRSKYKINDKPYLLYVGFLEPRKNIERLLKAFTQIKDTIPHILVIAGGRGWWYDATYALVHALNMGERILFTGYVPDEDLPPLYTGAELFLFPSLYEGFGIAALESINCGTPVLASDNSALPEIVGDAGVLVDPFSIDDIAGKMVGLLLDPEWLAACKSACSGVSGRFDWHKTARGTLQCIIDGTVQR